MDGSTHLPIDFADVVLIDSTGQVIESAFVRDGLFSIDPGQSGTFELAVMLLGYETWHTAEPVFYRAGTALALNDIALKMTDTGLEEITVTADKRKIVYKLDRQQLSGSASLSASGGTAVDVLNASPSIRVDADGEVLFRGSKGFLVYIDDKPAMLEGTQALEQIAASNIEDIEIITTPSARYRTDGDAGIINIKTKRSAAAGFSGVVNASAGTIGTWSGDVLLNYRQGKNRWYIGGSGAEIKRKSDFKQQKTTIIDDYTTASEADGVRHGNNRSYIGRLGWEFADERRHFLMLDFQAGETKNSRGGDMNYYEHRRFQDSVLNDNVYTSHDRYILQKKLVQQTTAYTWSINERGDKLALHGRLRYDWHSLEYTESNMFELSGERYEGTRGYETEHHWDFDGTLLYELNYRPGGRFEAGYQFTSYSEVGDYKIKYWDLAAKDFVWQESWATPFYYRRQIHSLYALFNDSFGPLTVNAGLRGDYTLDRLSIEVENANRNIRRWNLFPSAHLMYRVSEQDQFQAGYSYRTNRPGIWQLEPYITYEDYYTKKVGNPDIRPEYINSVEVGYRRSFSADNGVAVTGFYRSRTDVIDWIRRPYEPGVTLDSIVNAGNDKTYGLELSAQYKATDWWQLTLNGSVFGYKFKSKYAGSTDASNTSYTAALIQNFKLTRSTQLQFDANLIGPTVLTQGRERAYCYFDLAIKQQFLKNRLWISAVAHNVLGTASYKNRRSSPGLISSTYVRPKYPNILFSVSYSFNVAGPKDGGKSVSSGGLFEGKDF